MSIEFYTKLSQNYIELLKDDEYYDITIEVGEDPNVKIFRAHKNVVCYRSPYLRRILASNNRNRNNNTNDLVHIRLPDISSEIFQIILEYIYGGILSLNVNDASDFIKVLAAADELHLQELVDYLQNYLIENESEWMEQHFGFTQQISSKSSNLVVLQEFCTNLMTLSPEKIFKSFDFTSLSETSLVSLIKRDDLQMNEIEVWEHVLKWGLKQNPNLIPDPSIWSDDDFKKMKITLQHILPSIRFFSLSSKEFLQKVRPYKKLLNNQLYENIVNSHMNPDSEPVNNISPPRNIKIEKIIDSKIVNLDIVSMVSKWIDKTVIINNSKYNHLRELYLPYKFKLLLKGSRDGFTPKKFHELCDGIPNTVTFIKVNETEEILGGYNPLEWETTNSWGKTEDSFIFSFKDKNVKNATLSNVIDANRALDYSSTCGPKFGSDLNIFTCTNRNNRSNDVSKVFNVTYCKKVRYERNIRDTEDYFSIEDYEVFQIIRR
ncbi:uncharacterized protein OCT59_025346 [Rhizophagus irregularis]|uniref:Serine-enriched protein n=2 Tax=Rhizophagus irregularis TaxID=588596 RepID=A0A015KZE0_RHIIW|nr:hypothetical protein RirG_133490 [Rhizophagus irregularis DAOM 197198w]UZO04985.1 hypothetical protein OCT59_025346 [Rhizophagus irregularis]